MKIQSMIISILTATTACTNLSKQTFEVSGGDCPDPENILFEGDISTTVLRSTVDTEATDPDLNIECADLCAEAIFYEENRRPDEILSCDYTLNFEVLPEDFGTWEASDVIGTLKCNAQFVTMCMGRRPLGHVESIKMVRDLGSHFACIAHLEQASVTAFVDLARQLQGWSAPDELRRRCLAAAKDEVFHAKLFRKLAMECGAELEEPQQRSLSDDLLTVAIHNATEGCIFETWSALIAVHQALHSPHPELAKIYRCIAIDETQHGQLAWDIHKWMMSQLSVEEQQIIHTEQLKALTKLRNIAALESEDQFLGRPTRSKAQTLAAVFIEKVKAA
jgi:hypothetical protein